jgi:sugar lactone lactonase YvrE
MKLGKFLRRLLLILAIALPAFGVETTFWQVGSYDEFLQGTLTGLSLSRQGDVTLAPEAQAIFSPDEAMALSLARDSHGTIYVGTGHQGKVFRVGPDQKSSLVLTAHEPDIFALAVAPDGNLYAGSSPDGKVYKITADGKSSVFYDPKAKYIWALQFDAQGRLYVATGDKGQIFRVDATGKGELFYDSKQTHIMCLRLDLNGNVLAGSVPNGLIYRISSQGKAFVIYQAALPEVHDLAVDSQGRIFAATLGGAGSKGSPDLFMAPPQSGPGAGATTITVTASANSESIAKGQINPPNSKNPSFNRLNPQTSPVLPLQLGSGKGALVEIFPDSTVDTIWSANNESIFGLAVRNNHVLFTTDSNGRIFDLDAAPDGDKLTILTETHESLSTRLLVAGNDLYASTSNVAKLFHIGGSPSHEGTFESQVKDTKFVSHWGVLAWRGDVPPGCTLQFFTRSGNSDHPDSTWSDWAGPYSNPDGDAILNPPGRYMQWKAVLRNSGYGSPTLDEVTLSYLNQNLPPQIHSLNVSTSSERTGAAGAATSQLSSGISVTAAQGISYGIAPQSATSGKTPITLTWQADDPNSDQLLYSLYVKATDERGWHLLKDKILQPTYTIDPTTLADGKYVARLVASDEQSNPANLARKTELLSAPFWVDNTPPDVSVLKQTVTGATVEVQFVAEDETSPLRSAETSEDGKDWHAVLSDDGIVDSRRETFTVRLTHLTPGEHILALRASDTSGNIGVGKAIIHIPGGRTQ